MSPASQPSFIEEARRRQMIEATIEVVAEVGYAGASMAAIAKHAGLSKGLISYHFRDKDDLMEQALRVTAQQIYDGIVEGLDVEAPPAELMREGLRRTAAYGKTHRVQLRGLDQITRNLRDADGRPRLTHHDYEPVYRSQEALFRRGQADGSFRDFDTRVMAVTYQAAVDAMFSYTGDHDDADLDAYVESLIDLMVAAVTAP